jgi:hypothetical protein
MILRTLIIVGSLTLAYPTIASAEHQGSMEDQMACTPDVYRLCAAQIPDEDNIVACLTRNKPRLSPACARVFSDPAPAQRAPSHGDDDEDN